MNRAALLVPIALGLAADTLLPGPSHAQDKYTPSPPFWAVTGVAANDVLHLRDMPSAESKSLAGIPANARGLKNLGCRRNQLPLEQWMRMNEAQRQLAMTQWCRVEYHGKEGWVAGRYLKTDDKGGR